MAYEQGEQPHKMTPLAKVEEETLAFWRDHKVFEETLEKEAPQGSFVFYDGPPFATGLPHYGHLLASTIKDVIPRYKTMRGYRVARIWGWDCHGLPIENLIEQEFNLKRKSDIETFGIERFNEAARQSVLKYDAEWKKTIPRVGRFIDMDRSYKTMDSRYMESVWWAFKRLYDKGLVYEGYKSMHICPRCATTLSTSDVATGGYQPLTDISVVAKFALKDEPTTFVLAWTTTPWTLPGNVALAVGEDIEYAKVAVTTEDGTKEHYILAKDRLEMIQGDHEFITLLKGRDLVGREYVPVFDYYAKADIEHKENGWKIYPAAFVKTDEGTGIVHIAPAFGEDDLAMGQSRHLPFIQHVTIEGIMKDEVTDFAGREVKPKDNHQETDIEVIKYLAHHNLLFKKEKIVHSYPHCWRCDAPLLNYAASSWFVNVIALKDKLIEANNTISWVPDFVGNARFANWLEGARDWALSRSRFWGASIPVWRCDSCDMVEIIGSIEELKKKVAPARNTYLTVRHGEAVNNTEERVNSQIDEYYALTKKGEEQARDAGAHLKEHGIDIIISSPLPRTRGTAEIIADEVGIAREDIVFEEGLCEIGMGEFEGKTLDEYHEAFPWPSLLTRGPVGGESLAMLKRRMMTTLYQLEKRYEGKTILLVSHGSPLWMLHAGVDGLDNHGIIDVWGDATYNMKNAEVHPLTFVPLPHNRDFEVDLHRPYIDRVGWSCSCGGAMTRIEDVFDCWMESGSMPFARLHYPFENKELFEENFPADFIAEGLDQTRGWFYHMLILSVGLFDEAAYQQVIVNGLILAEDGQKMSKRLRNYPDVNMILDTYGADALRFYLLNSGVVRGEDLALSEAGIREVQNKVLTRLRNVVSFYELYTNEGEMVRPADSDHVLDVWIRSRLVEMTDEVTEALDRYELDRATRPIALFVDDLSTWYLRRSRDRFKGEDSDDQYHVIATTHIVLCELAKVMAPFTPFVAEEIYQRIHTHHDMRSVHLVSWPRYATNADGTTLREIVSRLLGRGRDNDILSDMARTREIVSLALEARSQVGMKVRQPLAELRVREKDSRIAGNEQLVALIRDELNVKEVVFGYGGQEEVSLDTVLTPDLIEEGDVRELIRQIQSLRKKGNLEPSQESILTVSTDSTGRHLIEKFEREIRKTATLEAINYNDTGQGEEMTIGERTFVLVVE